MIVSNHSLLMGAIESLLGDGGEFAVSSGDFRNQADLIAEIKQSKPDVVLIDEDVSVIQPVELIASWERTHNLRLIVLNSRINKMRVYDISECSISDTNQLIAAVRQFQEWESDGFIS